MLVHESLERSADRMPNKVGLICGDQRLTYAELEASANRLAHALRARNVNRGDRVVLWLPNTVELVVSIFAVMKAGGVFVTMNPTAKADKIAYVVKNCDACALITSGRHAPIASNLLLEVDSLRSIILTSPLQEHAVSPSSLSYDAVQESYPDDRPNKVNIDLDLACLIYTSGSTGEPKGVMCDHSNVVFAAGSIIEYLENVED
ncbi:MAG: AMP-binding protein, partial [Anaerolineales bacterium]|nr:AMP-binding protein [Anaerolineales bacterium]